MYTCRPELIGSYKIDVDTFIVSAVETLGGDSGKVFAVNILCEESVDMAGVTGNVLSLQFVSGSSNPCDSVLNVIVVGNLLCSVHCSYLIKKKSDE